MVIKRNELIQMMDVLENGEWSDGELDNVLMEFRHNITNAKTFYLVSTYIAMLFNHFYYTFIIILRIL